MTLYMIGNLIMLWQICEIGIGVALSLSAVVQLIAVNVVALAFFGERVSMVQAAGLAVVAVAMITLGPAPG